MAKSRSAYLHPQQRERIQQLSRSWLWRSELPTWLLIFAIYGGWFASLAWWRAGAVPGHAAAGLVHRLVYVTAARVHSRPSHLAAVV